MKGRLILEQLKQDLTGKDSYRGVTLTYAWISNQFGHFALGFIPSMILYQVFELEDSYEDPMIIALMVLAFWLLFESINFLGPLLIESNSKKSFPFFKTKGTYTFNPRWLNIGLDTFTDICFFCIGAFTYSILISYSHFNLFILLFLLVIIFKPCNYWFLSKMYQWHAQYPFQFRLSQWNLTMTETNKRKVIRFIKDTEVKSKHLLVYGGHKSGKTSLAVGIGNELSLKQRSCLYISAIKLMGELYYDDSNKEMNKSLWNWRDVEYLIIDDINPGSPINEEFLSATKFLNQIDTGTICNEPNRETLKNKNIIWILGNKNENTWNEMIRTLGVRHENIIELNLKEYDSRKQN